MRAPVINDKISTIVQFDMRMNDSGGLSLTQPFFQFEGRYRINTNTQTHKCSAFFVTLIKIDKIFSLLSALECISLACIMTSKNNIMAPVYTKLENRFIV